MPNLTDILAWVPCPDCSCSISRGCSHHPDCSGQRPLYEQLWRVCDGHECLISLRWHMCVTDSTSNSGCTECPCGGKGLVPNVTLEGVLEALLKGWDVAISGRLEGYRKGKRYECVIYTGEDMRQLEGDTLLEAATAALTAVTEALKSST